MMSDERRRLARIKSNLERRALVYEFTRAFFRERGFLEVETPVRVPGVAPELHIEPFDSEGWFLSTSPELYMKRLLAAGYDKLFQFSHCFRKGERGRWHNPEFTLLEWYRVGADYTRLLLDTEELVVELTRRLGFGAVIRYQGQNINLATPWRRATVRDAFLSAAGWDPLADPDPTKFDIDLCDKVIPAFGGSPTILRDYPADMASLARLKSSEPGVAERGEVFIAGLEIANAYSELRDYHEQERRFQKEIEQINRDRRRRAAMPPRFLEALRHLPECGGIALGVDRLVMLFCDAGAIDDVVAFTADLA